jgi:hypothetical protein
MYASIISRKNTQKTMKKGIQMMLNYKYISKWCGVGSDTDLNSQLIYAYVENCMFVNINLVKRQWQAVDNNVTLQSIL